MAVAAWIMVIGLHRIAVPTMAVAAKVNGTTVVAWIFAIVAQMVRMIWLTALQLRTLVVLDAVDIN